ncbi:MAG: winged helix-turn-helix transcriptional regulator [Bacilli bacterium]|nr:winged helix-turn-helix transcriptional regulator [Bacilli bacterium]
MNVSKNLSISDLIMIYSALGEETRLAIAIYLLENPSNVNAISKNLNLSQPKVSHHLRILKDSKVVKATKDGKNVIYDIDDKHIEEIIKLGLVHMEC